MEWISKISLILMIVGGLNWGLVGVFNFDLVAFLFGSVGVLTRIIYILIGLSALWMLFDFSSTKEMGK